MQMSIFINAVNGSNLQGLGIWDELREHFLGIKTWPTNETKAVRQSSDLISHLYLVSTSNKLWWKQVLEQAFLKASSTVDVLTIDGWPSVYTVNDHCSAIPFTRTASPRGPRSCKYGYRTDNKEPPVTYRFLNLSVVLDLSPGEFLLSISSQC